MDSIIRILTLRAFLTFLETFSSISSNASIKLITSSAKWAGFTDPEGSKVVKKVQNAPIGTDVNQIISNDDLAKVSGSTTKYLLDKQTVRSLSYMSFKQRRAACEKLSGAIALTRFTNDMDQAVDVLNIFENNPNLPDKRKRELQRKTRNLKDSIDLVVLLHNTQIFF